MGHPGVSQLRRVVLLWQCKITKPCFEERSLTPAFQVRFLLTRDTEHVKTILTSKFTDFGKGDRFHETWSPFLGDSIFTTDGQVWQENRSLIRPMFIREKVRDLYIFEKWTQTLISKLPAPGVTVDVMDLFYRMTLDVTTDFLLGTSVNSLNKQVELVPVFCIP